MTLALDLGGNDLIVNSITTGVSTSGGAVNATTPITLSAGTTIKSNVAATALTSNIATVTNYVLQCTTPSLSTAAGSAQTEVITLTGLAATDIAFVQAAGGTNTRKNFTLEAVATSNTLTITITNTEPSNALNGTIIFNVLIMKA